ncbi:hypothetical protein HOP50_07g49750 [Chloropicon primus]|uniref:Post-GPI attachment to proteins factor 3 n=1 Tax=Chloropicon primus TaxID=1764295 RepID=A0A5B8MS05_9CHLO|nr:hypothetical protein A3770_07p49530 [Chloropicon primus]UPR01653.1 hypothetical protein HOP50_07g49750 [Chloropicon primus]|mmetsp:Transcript_11628/g.32233  ORF Transcript_11628/g.32233 Transcript_11628/m.32233 type:complete len:223 (+) Transcript_11628:156-824(+)|eukprot:QDZ22435.1 hypothetical protein A3770_07p49530 [Chloropicon primus]
MYVPIEDITHTGIPWKDSLPLTTMVFCYLPLYATFRKGLPFQFLCASLSCGVASLYHWLLYSGDRAVLGLTADDWRQLDIAVACYCLGICLAYVLHAHHEINTVTTRVVVPVAMAWMHLRGAEHATFAKVLIANSVFVFLGRLIFRTKNVPVYDWSYLKYAVPSILISLVFFPLPVVWPHMYWLYHSLWHVFMGLGLFVCYGFLHTGSYKARKKAKAKRKTK